MRRLVSLLSLLSMLIIFGAACSDPVSPASCSGIPQGSNNCAASYDSGIPQGSNN